MGKLPKQNPLAYSLLSTVEEHAIAFVSDHRVQVSGGIGRLREKREPRLVRRPLDRCFRLNILPSEVLVFVRHDRPVDYPTPFDIKRDCGWHWSDRRYRWVRKALSTGQRVRKIVEIHHRHIDHMQRSAARAWADLHNVLWRGDQPKQAILCNPWIVVMNLLGQVCRSDRTGVNVQSDKDERTVMMIAIFADILALHESHVGAKRERLSKSGSCASPAYLGVANDTVKVGDL